MRTNHESISETVRMDESYAPSREGTNQESIGTVDPETIQDAISDEEDNNQMDEEWNQYMKEEEQFESKNEKTKENDRITGNISCC